ncbi:CLUMA_CG016108, isoform A [Clunio marinus]|uniref:CLUMA_CG016108, isoform A n=1 Tax=Clunio marinus TaxID=568069 RepID=A0A1J1IRD5_9DIPT|nr:CLUMA_CG016108, isoform A [Clunio marinus]
MTQDPIRDMPKTDHKHNKIDKLISEILNPYDENDRSLMNNIEYERCWKCYAIKILWDYELSHFH